MIELLFSLQQIKYYFSLIFFFLLMHDSHLIFIFFSGCAGFLLLLEGFL